jgi:hypothetical protein
MVRPEPAAPMRLRNRLWTRAAAAGPDKINPWNALERAPGRLIGQWSGFDTTTVFALIKVGLIWAQFGPSLGPDKKAGTRPAFTSLIFMVGAPGIEPGTPAV